MQKVEFGAKSFLYPMPTTLVGANVEGTPNYLTIAHVGIMKYNPDLLTISLHKGHYTNPGIKENKTFSINIPSTNMVEVTDYCGIVSGRKVNKYELFETFYGKLETAPMIKECPINMECRFIEALDFKSHEIFVGEVVASYCNEDCVKDGMPDLTLVDPILFTFFGKDYWKIGERFARAWHAGKGYRRKE